MPRPGDRCITVKDSQWKAIEQLVHRYPNIVGRTVSAFYREAAQERLLHFYKSLDIKPEPVSGTSTEG